MMHITPRHARRTERWARAIDTLLGLLILLAIAFLGGVGGGAMVLLAERMAS